MHCGGVPMAHSCFVDWIPTFCLARKEEPTLFLSSQVGMPLMHNPSMCLTVWGLRRGDKGARCGPDRDRTRPHHRWDCTAEGSVFSGCLRRERVIHDIDQDHLGFHHWM